MARKLDCIALGRAAVDLYSQQIGARLEDVSSFAKYLGGSSGNIAYGTARLGLKSAMLTRVGNEQMGRFVTEELERVGCDTSNVVVDDERLTGLAILALKDKDTFPLLFYRRDCADMAINKADINKDFIASAKALVITGTHFSTDSTYEASCYALECAEEVGTKRVLDIDYRPVLWGLTDLGNGEERFIANEATSKHLQTILPKFDLIVGTEEEFHIAGGSEDTIAALRKVRELSNATLVCKRGPLGCSVFEGEIPDTLDEGITVYGVKVEVMNVLGAGDAFMSGFLRGWLRDEPIETCCAYANACGAIVVSRHGCAPAIPSWEELSNYIGRAKDVLRPDLDDTLNHLHRVTTRDERWDELYVLAFDHRRQMFEIAQNYGKTEADVETIKYLMAEAFEDAVKQGGLDGKAGILCDDLYGEEALSRITGQNAWIGRPVEMPYSRPLYLMHGQSMGSTLVKWPKQHVMKCLVQYHPNDPEALRRKQENEVIETFRAAQQSNHQLLLEIVLPAALGRDEEDYLRSMKRFYNLGVKPDWWKLPQMSAATWEAMSALIKERDPHCHGILILGLDAAEEDIAEGFKSAKGIDLCKGFAIGRTIFGAPAHAWFAGEMDDSAFKASIVERYLRLVELWKANAE